MKGDEKVNMEQQPPPYPHQQQPPPLGPPQQLQMAPVVLSQAMVGKNPEVVSCSNCRAEVRTRVVRSLSQNGWIWSIVLWYGIFINFKNLGEKKLDIISGCSPAAAASSRVSWTASMTMNTTALTVISLLGSQRLMIEIKRERRV